VFGSLVEGHRKCIIQTGQKIPSLGRVGGSRKGKVEGGRQMGIKISKKP